VLHYFPILLTFTLTLTFLLIPIIPLLLHSIFPLLPLSLQHLPAPSGLCALGPLSLEEGHQAARPQAHPPGPKHVPLFFILLTLLLDLQALLPPLPPMQPPPLPSSISCPPLPSSVSPP
ncbi:hypothetical protein BS17DRAFT_812477, partial [Gyrodon lividus]